MKRVKRYKNLRETENLKIRRTEHHTPATPRKDLNKKIKRLENDKWKKNRNDANGYKIH